MKPAMWASESPRAISAKGHSMGWVSMWKLRLRSRWAQIIPSASTHNDLNRLCEKIKGQVVYSHGDQHWIHTSYLTNNSRVERCNRHRIVCGNLPDRSNDTGHALSCILKSNRPSLAYYRHHIPHLLLQHRCRIHSDNVANIHPHQPCSHRHRSPSHGLASWSFPTDMSGI